MEQATGLSSGTLDVFEGERDDVVDRLDCGADAAGHDDHGGRSIRPVPQQAHGMAPHFGQPSAYRPAASSRSMPSWFASAASHASTSPSSWTWSARLPLRTA